MFHNIGKSWIPESLLKKQGSLTDIEWGIFLNHPVYGDEILREHGITGSPYREIVRHHHEKLDGTEYPDGLKGNNVSPLAQIASIVEIYDALTTNRPYGKKVSSFDALVQMKDDNGGGRVFKWKLFEEFVGMLAADSRTATPSKTPPETDKAQPKPESRRAKSRSWPKRNTGIEETSIIPHSLPLFRKV
jgi:HD-GYP domain-containing protein (c-di-GMP phosphodiesterase class II)